MAFAFFLMIRNPYSRKSVSHLTNHISSRQTLWYSFHLLFHRYSILDEDIVTMLVLFCQFRSKSQLLFIINWDLCTRIILLCIVENQFMDNGYFVEYPHVACYSVWQCHCELILLMDTELLLVLVWCFWQFLGVIFRCF